MRSVRSANLAVEYLLGTAIMVAALVAFGVHYLGTVAARQGASGHIGITIKTLMAANDGNNVYFYIYLISPSTRTVCVTKITLMDVGTNKTLTISYTEQNSSILGPQLPDCLPPGYMGSLNLIVRYPAYFPVGTTVVALLQYTLASTGQSAQILAVTTVQQTQMIEGG